MTDKTPLGAVDALRQAKTVSAAAKLIHIPRTTFYSRLASEIISAGTSVPKLDIIEEHRLRSEVVRLRSELKGALGRADEATKRADLLESIDGNALAPPEWVLQTPKGKTHHAIITAFLSDTHFDETVRASEMNGVNAYNREIAVLRLQKFFRGVIKLSRDYIAGVKIDGLVLPLGGDIVSGNIHEELERTNAAPILDTVQYWPEQIAAGIELLLKFFPNIYIPCVVGNHGRLRKKPQYKTRVRDNYDWLIYKILAGYFRDNPRVTFNVPDSPDCHYNVFKTRYLLTHGDQFSGGGGIGGLAVPIMRGDAKKQQRETALGRSYDYMHIGHWHQRRNLGSVLINGSPKGYDEFAAQHNFSYEVPQQSMWVTTPERGMTFEAPIFVQSKLEKW